MKTISLSYHRKCLKKHIKNTNSIYAERYHRVGVSDIDGFFRYISQIKKEGIKANNEALEDEFSLARMSSVCVGLMGLSVHPKDNEENILPANWLDKDGRPNPNHVFEMQFIQIANFSYSVIALAEQGLDNPARSLVRVLSELIQQTLVLASSQEYMRQYVSAKDDQAATKIWYKLFGRGRLDKKLTSLEERLGLPEDILIAMRKSRKGDNEFYSQSVHHSFLASVVGSISWNHGDEEKGSLGFFGGENSAVGAPLQHLNFNLWYFLLAFFAILDKVHGVKPKNIEDAFWLEAWALKFTIKELFLTMLRDKESYE